jgi:hypothetical protein
LIGGGAKHDQSVFMQNDISIDKSRKFAIIEVGSSKEKRRTGYGKRKEVRTMGKQTAMQAEQSFFAVFCIEALADELGTTGDKIYKMLTEDSDILDGYILPCWDALHTQGKSYIVRELSELMQERGVLP